MHVSTMRHATNSSMIVDHQQTIIMQQVVVAAINIILNNMHIDHRQFLWLFVYKDSVLEACALWYLDRY